MGFLGAELLLAAFVLCGVGLTLVSPLTPSIPLADVGFPTAAVATVLLTVTSLLAGSRRFVRFVTGRGGLEIESFWRMLELMLAFLVAGIVALTIQLGEFALSVPNPRGGGVFVGLFFALILSGVGLAVIVCLRGMWRVVNAEIQAALGGV
ncbi:hypothetical protein GJR96_14240 [Haloferax sp. MBLA0076]|uniref:Uncharacterized protein n=1 Tax=Haloferax litoreum TaxID=2666140 RepID=A0A6A8GMW0_9EURY|nr:MULTISPECIES: hypothetical protein [Haloferax]KAB1194874.1 hypothetical protein Hfx1148_14175 [Haloferax sp. CBA1148]MRX23110.1 hypothetical protein [Haloferax litoreum]